MHKIVYHSPVRNPDRVLITTAVPFLNFAPDSRICNGWVGVALLLDCKIRLIGITGKLAFSLETNGILTSLSPWLRGISDDNDPWVIWTGFLQNRWVRTFGFDLEIFNNGDIQLTASRKWIRIQFNLETLLLVAPIQKNWLLHWIRISARLSIQSFWNFSLDGYWKQTRNSGLDKMVVFTITKPISFRI